MIKINLMPDRLKKKNRGISLNIPQLPREILILIVGAVGLFLVLAHLLLIGRLIMQKIRLSGVRLSFQQIEAPRKQADVLKEEISKIEARVNSYAALTDRAKQIIWAKKLNQLSDFLPSGMWLTKLSFLDKQLNIEGSAISKRGEEMVLVGKFTSALKDDASFAKEFKSIELTSIDRKSIKNVEVADFVILVNLKD